MFKARIRNVLAVETADLDLRDELLLVAGQNGAGKTTLIQALGAAATGSWSMRGLTHRRDLARLVRRGASEGVALMEYPGGSCRVSWPDGAVEQQGKPLDLGTPLGIGAARFGPLSDERRLAEVQARFKTAPSRADYDAWWREHPVIGMDPDAPAQVDDNGRPLESALDVLWEDVNTSGWDTVAKRLSTAAIVVQGRWSEVARQRWGSRVRLDWAPAGLHRGEQYSAEDAKAAVVAAEDELTRLLTAGRVSEGFRQGLRDKASLLDQHQQMHDAATAIAASKQVEVERLIEALEKDGIPPDPRNYPRCPGCGAVLTVGRSSGAMTLERAPERLDMNAYESAMRQREALLGALAEARLAAGAAERDAMVAMSKIREAQAAVAHLAEIAGLPLVQDSEIADARLKLIDAQEHRDRVRRLHRATDLNHEWEQTVALRDALLPEGIRQRVFGARMSAINEALGKVSQALGFKDVQLGADAGLTYDGFPYDMVSESEAWRCDLAMAMLMNRQEGAKLFLCDRLDLLQAQSRQAALSGMRALGIPVVVAMTARDAATAPDVKPLGLGRTCWLGGGKLEARIA